MRIVWYRPSDTPPVYQPRYFPVCLDRAEDTVYLPTLDPLQVIEEAVDQLFQDDQISVRELDEVLSALYDRVPREQSDLHRPARSFLQLAQFQQVPGLHPFIVEVHPGTFGAVVPDIRRVRVEMEEDREEERLGIWLWIGGYSEADIIDVDVENTYLADADGEILARLSERPRPYRRPDLDDEENEDEPFSRPLGAPGAHEVMYGLNLLLDLPAERESVPGLPLDVLHVHLLRLRVQRQVVEWRFTDEPPVYPLIKDAGSTVVLVEGFRKGQVDAGDERGILDGINQFGNLRPLEYHREHPVLLIAARTAELRQAEYLPDEWRSPLDLLMRCPLSVTLQREDGRLVEPMSSQISVTSSHTNELEAVYHFWQYEELPEWKVMRVEVLTVEGLGE